MSDFNDNWQLTGSSDPATPDIQPHQIETQTPAQPVFQQPVVPVQPVQPAYQQSAPQPVYQQPAAPPVYQQPVAQPVYQQNAAQPVYQQPAYQQPVGQPVYQQPAAQPVYQQPVAQPVYQQNVQPGTAGYGNPQQAVAYQNANYAEEREKNLNEVSRMINHFSPKVDLYEDYEKCKTDIARYSKISVATLIWGILVVLFGMIPTFMAVTAHYKDTIIQNAIIAGVTILIGAGLITLYILKRVFNKKKVESLYEKLGELSTELNLLYNGFSNCVLPAEYTDPRILFKLQALITSGRCITIGNALNALLCVNNTYMRINAAKTRFQKDTSDRFEGKPAFFNAVRYINLR